MFPKRPKSTTTLEQNTRSQICCNINIKTGTYVIAWFELLLIVTNSICKAFGFLDTAWNWELLFLVVDSVAVTSLLYGINRQRAAFLQPFVVLNIMTISLLILLTVFFGSATIDQHSYAGEYVEMELRESAQTLAKLMHVEQKNVVQLVGAFSALLIGISTLVHLWFFKIVVNCAQYFRLLEKESVDVQLDANPERVDTADDESHLAKDHPGLV